MHGDQIRKCLPYLEQEFLDEIRENSSLKRFAAQEYIIQQGQYIQELPIVLSGSVKVFCEEETVRFLLYFIAPGEPCIFSFAHLFNEEPIEFSAFAELDCELLMLPVRKVQDWVRKYPSLANMLLASYQKHYQDLLHTTKQITCYNLEQRLEAYLKTKAEIDRSDLLSISHQEIANDLGTSREVISRLLKKLSLDKKVVQVGRKIKVLGSDKGH